MINWGTITPIIVGIIGISGVWPFVDHVYIRPSIDINIGTEPESMSSMR
jgi:hypothetical protein